ncbi:PKD domain-containing protein [Myxococcota bacterium]|nr:PKD domain-containing protein [Myxococcota bacterium]
MYTLSSLTSRSSRAPRATVRLGVALALAVVAAPRAAHAQLDTSCALDCQAPITAECALPFSADVDPGQPAPSNGCASGSVGVPDRSIREGYPFSMTGVFDDYVRDTWTATVDFGDGAGPEPLTIAADRSFHFTHVYPDDGRYTLRVTVTDDSGAVGEDVSEIVVDNFVPVVSAGPSAALDEGQTFASSGSFVDTGADTWSATVDYGDGSGPEALALADDGTFALLHHYAFPGEFLVTVVVTDDDGGRGTGTALVTVRNVAPMPLIVVAPGGDLIDEAQTFVATGSFLDPGPGPFAATVDYGDGSGVSPLALAPDGTFVLSHFYGDDGFFPVTVTVVDGAGASGTAMVRVTVNNLAPTVDAGPGAHRDDRLGRRVGRAGPHARGRRHVPRRARLRDPRVVHRARPRDRR